MYNAWANNQSRKKFNLLLAGTTCVYQRRLDFPDAFLLSRVIRILMLLLDKSSSQQVSSQFQKCASQKLLSIPTSHPDRIVSCTVVYWPDDTGVAASLLFLISWTHFHIQQDTRTKLHGVNMHNHTNTQTHTGNIGHGVSPSSATVFSLSTQMRTMKDKTLTRL